MRKLLFCWGWLGPGLALAQLPASPPAPAYARLDRVIFYSLTVEPALSPDTLAQAPYFIELYAASRPARCSQHCYLFRPAQATCFYLKKFTVADGADTVITEAPLVLLSRRSTTRLERFVRLTARNLAAPYSVHFGLQAGPVSQPAAQRPEPPVYWRLTVTRRPPYAPFRGQWSNTEELPAGVVRSCPLYYLRRNLAYRRLRRIGRPYGLVPPAG